MTKSYSHMSEDIFKPAGPSERAYSTRWPIAPPMLALAMLTVVVHGRLIFAEFVWDDVFLIERNPGLMHFGTAWEMAWGDFFGQTHATRSGYLRPVPTLLNALTIWCFGPSALVFHCIQLILHLLVIGVSLLVFRAIGFTAWGSTAALAIFSIHPMQVEVLAFVSCRPELLAATFVMFTVLCLQKYQHDGRSRWILFGCMAVAMGVLSKEHALMIIPALCLPIFDHQETNRRRFLTWLSISALAVIGLRIAFMPGSPAGGTGIIDSLLRALNLLGFYLTQLFVVEGPRCLYSYLNLSNWSVQTWLAISTLGSIAYAIRTRTVLLKTSGSLASWFVLFLIPVLHFIPIGTIAADRYLYIPLVGVAGLIALVFDRLRMRARIEKIIWSVGLLVCMTWFSVGAAQRGSDWSNEEALWSAELSQPPRQYQALVELGTVYAESKRSDAATKAYRLAWKMRPGGGVLFRNLLRLESSDLPADIRQLFLRDCLDPKQQPRKCMRWRERLVRVRPSHL